MSYGRKLNVLGIESSCDDTGVAIVNEKGDILSNCVHSQLKQHLANGGIIPILAKEYHLSNIDRIAKEAFEKSRLKSVAEDVDAIAVTNCPGLKFSLQVGLNYARALAKKYSKPLIPIHHMQAHALMPLLQNPSIKFPFLAVLISGGHGLLAIAKRYDDFHILGSTRDDAPGDIFDKYARRFKFKNFGPPFESMSGGAAMEFLSRREGADRFKHLNSDESIPMRGINSCDFSFAGYRGALDRLAPAIDELWAKGDREALLDELSHICASLQRGVLIQLVRKLHRAMMFYRMHWRFKNEDAFENASNSNHLGFKLLNIDDDPDVVVSGGVAANSYLIDGIRQACREGFSKKSEVHAPTRDLCSDNGLMIAYNGLLRLQDSLVNPMINSMRVIYDKSQMDLIEAEARCPMGLDLRDEVRAANFKISRLRHQEFNVKK